MQARKRGQCLASLITRSKVAGNTNRTLDWRRQYLEGVFGAPCPMYAAAASKPDAGAPALLPVSVVAEPSEATPTSYETNSLSGSVCEIEFDRARVRICGEVSPAILRLLIRELAR
jgi:transposase